MIELLVGFILGLGIAGLFRHDVDELEAENRQLRQALRTVRTALATDQTRRRWPHLIAQIDRILCDEAGA